MANSAFRTKLAKVLKDLWQDDDSVPAVWTSRCTKLDWFSSGVKDNIVAHIAVEMFGKEEAEQILGEEL